MKMKRSNIHDKNPKKTISQRVGLDLRSKMILENWFETNKSHPYATKTDLRILELKTFINKQKIKKWIENKRAHSIQTTLSHQRLIFSKEEKIILEDFFNLKTNYPGPEDLSYLAIIIQKDIKKIRSWFNNQRYKVKNTSN